MHTTEQGSGVAVRGCARVPTHTPLRWTSARCPTTHCTAYSPVRTPRTPTPADNACAQCVCVCSNRSSHTIHVCVRAQVWFLMDVARSSAATVRAVAHVCMCAHHTQTHTCAVTVVCVYVCVCACVQTNGRVFAVHLRRAVA